jgi:hypothetical protein
MRDHVLSSYRKTEIDLRKIVLCLVTIFVLIGCRTDPLDEPSRSVKKGMSRDEAIAVLESQAWYYQPCPNNGGMNDLFFFGSHEWDSASTLIVSSRLSGEEMRVFDVSSFDEANAWHAEFRSCLQRDKFAR